MAALINGYEYNYSQVKISLLGATIEGISAINYSSKQEKKNNYGRGSNPVSRSKGMKEYSADITISMKEMLGVQRAAKAKGYKTIMDIPAFTIEVTYTPENNNALVNDRILYAEFTNNNRELKSGGEQVEIKCELIIGEIEFDV